MHKLMMITKEYYRLDETYIKKLIIKHKEKGSESWRGVSVSQHPQRLCVGPTSTRRLEYIQNEHLHNTQLCSQIKLVEPCSSQIETVNATEKPSSLSQIGFPHLRSPAYIILWFRWVLNPFTLRHLSDMVRQRSTHINV